MQVIHGQGNGIGHMQVTHGHGTGHMQVTQVNGMGHIQVSHGFDHGHAESKNTLALKMGHEGHQMTSNRHNHVGSSEMSSHTHQQGGSNSHQVTSNIQKVVTKQTGGGAIDAQKMSSNVHHHAVSAGF